MAKEGIYRTGKVAESLGLSPHQVRRLCETGLIAAKPGPGGQWQIAATEVARLQSDGIPPIPSATSNEAPADGEVRLTVKSNLRRSFAASTESSLDEEFSLPRNHRNSNGIDREAELEPEWWEVPVRQAVKTPAPVFPVEPAQNSLNREQWHNRWLENALWRVPRGTPEEFRLEVKDEVDKILRNLQPNSSDLVTRQLVEAGVQRGLKTWRSLQDTEQALNIALGALPSAATSYWQPTNWQIQAREEATREISKLREGDSLQNKLFVATVAVQRVAQQFEEQSLRKKIVVEPILLPMLSIAEQEEARAAVRTRVESSQPGANEAELRKARQIALMPFQEAQVQREARKQLELQVDQGLSHIRTCLLKWWNAGELEGFEGYSEVWRYADEIRDDVRVELLQNLNDGQPVNYQRIKDKIEEIVDELLLR